MGFHKMGLNSITAIVTQQNTRSVRVFEKMGFRKVGIRREYHFINEERLDEILFEIIKKDYIKNNLT